MHFPIISTPLLNDLGVGDFRGYTINDIKDQFPEEYECMQKDKLRYRFPGPKGESYLDLVQRLAPIIIELERQRRSVLIVSSQAVCRCLYAYFVGVPMDKIPEIDLNLYSVTELRPSPFDCGAVQRSFRNNP